MLNIAKYLEKNGFKVTRAPIDLYGRVSLKKLRARITDETILVSVGWASNEIGTVQPIAGDRARCSTAPASPCTPTRSRPRACCPST